MAWRKSTGFAARVSALAVPLAWAGCADDSVSLRVECAVFPEAEESSCVYDPEGECLIEGALNINSGAFYTGAVRVTSGLTPRSSDIPVQAETNNISITEFEIDVLRTSGDRITFTDLPNPFRIATSGFVPVGGSGIASGDFLPAPYVKQISAAEKTSGALGQVIVQVTVRGKTSGDVEVEAAPWSWPIRLYDIVPTDSRQCVLFDTAVCTPGQDAFVAACTNQTQE
jgi:hypothetical protein